MKKYKSKNWKNQKTCVKFAFQENYAFINYTYFAENFTNPEAILS